MPRSLSCSRIAWRDLVRDKENWVLKNRGKTRLLPLHGAIRIKRFDFIAWTFIDFSKIQPLMVSLWQWKRSIFPQTRALIFSRNFFNETLVIFAHHSLLAIKHLPLYFKLWKSLETLQSGKFQLASFSGVSFPQGLSSALLIRRAGTLQFKI